MKQVKLSSHFASHYYRFSPFHKTLCSTYEPTWHLESCLKCLFLPLQQDNTLNRWRKLASWVMIEICNSSTLQCNTFNVWRKLTCGVLFWNLSPLDPTKQYIHSGPYKTQHSTSFSMNKPSRAMFNMSFPYLCKPIRWIYEQSRNVTSSLYLNSSPSPEKQYLEQTKEWAFDIYNSVTLHCNTLNMWS